MKKNKRGDGSSLGAVRAPMYNVRDAVGGTVRDGTSVP